MAEFMSTGRSKWHTVTRGSGLMDPSLTVCSLSAKTIVINHASTLITCGALLLRRTLLAEAVRKKAESPVSEMFTLMEASGGFRLRKTGSYTASVSITNWTRQPRELRAQEKNYAARVQGGGRKGKIQGR